VTVTVSKLPSRSAPNVVAFNSMKLSIPTSKDFSFKRTLLSHGWCGLLPFSYDQKTWTIVRVLDAGKGRPTTATITGKARSIEVTVARSSRGVRTSEKIKRDVRHMFRLDDSMANFYSAMSSDPNFAWITRAGAGRMLRSPTVFEDLVKSICTTNCSWALTVKMVTELTNRLGRPTSDGLHAFPTSEAMARAPLSFYRDKMRAGYRGPYFKELAQRVASGSLDVEGWLNSSLPTDELKKEMKTVKGVGDYASENLLKLVGRFDVLALDSWLRSRFASIHNNGRACSDKKIARHYKNFKSWRGLALWCDMTKDWIEEKDEG
jgi:3-methyladenine DNA glycosylase/8-oxoguanine DNA glycosylase